MPSTLTIDLTELRQNPAFAAAVLAIIHGALDTDAATPAVASPRGSRRAQRKYATEGAGGWDGFKATLSLGTLRFLDLVQEKGTISLPEVAEALQTIPKAIGGLTGAMQRKAGNRGITVPIRVGVNDVGARTWTWTGVGPIDSAREESLETGAVVEPAAEATA